MRDLPCVGRPLGCARQSHRADLVPDGGARTMAVSVDASWTPVSRQPKANALDTAGTTADAGEASAAGRVGEDRRQSPDREGRQPVPRARVDDRRPSPAQGEVLITEVMYDPIATEPRERVDRGPQQSRRAHAHSPGSRSRTARTART